ncbi:hypothetical protein LIP_0459 [Limnochorda pilosa]|uniref:Uncharacterized protein n=1 Tax=Limnochorda pilosa TaxID=1555112 RepID=A0A0K2SGS6_LIMPI|nr:hypothetical protein LIP_0459 [Limnochorda pilosa]
MTKSKQRKGTFRVNASTPSPLLSFPAPQIEERFDKHGLTAFGGANLLVDLFDDLGLPRPGGTRPGAAPHPQVSVGHLLPDHRGGVPDPEGRPGDGPYDRDR